MAHLLEAERLGKPAHATFEFKPDRKVANLSANATASEKGSESKIEGCVGQTASKLTSQRGRVDAVARQVRADFVVQEAGPHLRLRYHHVRRSLRCSR